ncbi:MAG TPA: hypothetical protein VLZ12_00905 [Verrucomicrobiae bacterium]|nr:hypothetical protein [Verrucomicrobiae bacterium]
MRRTLLLCGLAMLWPVVARAQFSADCQTNIISGVVSNWTGDVPLNGYYVGSNTSFDVLLVENGGGLSNVWGFIGLQANASNNSAIATGSNSVWKCSNQLAVGWYGSGNTLIVSNGATVQTLACHVAYQNSSSNNSIIVTGEGSILETPFNVNVGDCGQGNHLVISDGGAVLYGASAWPDTDSMTVLSGNVGGGACGGSHNSAQVTGTGSIWKTSSSLGVGTPGDDNHLIISNGAHVVNGSAIVSLGVNSNNTVLVTGAGSLWQNDRTLRIGGANNTVTIADGGSVVASDVYVSTSNSGHEGNEINVNGGSLYVTNGGIYVGYGGEGTLQVSNGSVRANSIRLAQLSGSIGHMTAMDADIVVSGSFGMGGGDAFFSQCTLTIGNFYVSRATFTAIDCALALSGFASVSDFAGTGTVWITGGQLTATNAATSVATFGTGQMICSNSLVDLATLTVSASPNAGTLTVVGGSFVARQFDVGHAGSGSTGVVWICDEATVTATNDTSIVGESGIGSMTISNSCVRLAALTLGKYFLVDTFGTLTVAGGTVTLTGALTVGEKGLTNVPVGNKGVIWLTAGQLIATNEPSYLGVAGTGQMNVSNGVFLAQRVSIGGLKSSLTVGGGTVAIAESLLVDALTCAQTGVVMVTSGSLGVTTAATAATVEVRSGTFTVTGGSVVIDRLVLTNACARFIHTGGNLVVGLLILDPSLDADGDGLPNGWEQSHGLDPLTPSAGDDPDGDGLSNAQEFSLGTDPTGNSSPYRIAAIAQEGDSIRITWTTVGGKTNFVQATSDLASSFADISSAIAITGAGLTSTNYLDAGALTNFPSRFYRIRLMP